MRGHAARAALPALSAALQGAVRRWRMVLGTLGGRAARPVLASSTARSAAVRVPLPLLAALQAHLEPLVNQVGAGGGSAATQRAGHAGSADSGCALWVGSRWSGLPSAVTPSALLPLSAARRAIMSSCSPPAATPSCPACGSWAPGARCPAPSASTCSTSCLCGLRVRAGCVACCAALGRAMKDRAG